jgi:hypothetical protein
LTTNAYAAKRAIIARLQERAAEPGNALSTRQVAYSWPGQTAELVCVYGGGIIFDQPGDEAVQSGPTDRLARETATVMLHVRVAQSPPGEGGIADTDELAEAIGGEVGRLLMAEPKLAGGGSVARVASGQGDYSAVDDQAVSILSYRISVDSWVQ